MPEKRKRKVIRERKWSLRGRIKNTLIQKKKREIRQRRIKNAITNFSSAINVACSLLGVLVRTTALVALRCIKRDVSESERQKDSGKRKNQEYLTNERSTQIPVKERKSHEKKEKVVKETKVLTVNQLLPAVPRGGNYLFRLATVSL
jgi:uncharacterized membrane protein YdbT with pleckstrin-like domain